MSKVCIDCRKPICDVSTRCHSCAAKASWSNERRKAYASQQSEKIKIAWLRGVYDTEEYRQRQSEATKAAWRRGVFDNQEHRQRRSKATRAAWAKEDSKFGTEEHRLKRSEGIKAAWKRGAYDYVDNNPSQLELQVAAALSIMGIKYSTQHRPENASYPFDFFLPAMNLLIEVDGDFFHHSNWAMERGHVKRDKLKNKLAEQLGYKLLRIQEKDIKENGAWAIVYREIWPFYIAQE